MILAVPREKGEHERRVALIPDSVARLVKQGVEVHVESGAGEEAYFFDKSYEQAGAILVSNEETLWEQADILVKVGAPQEKNGAHTINHLHKSAVFIGFLNPLGNPKFIEHLAQRNITAFSMEMIPRISRAQSMDALTSQASVAGYKAVLLAAGKLGKFFPMLTTAAGTVRPAQVLILGVGVAGLQAIATARRLGAIVKAFDIRPVVKEQVASLGAEFIDATISEDTETSGGYAKEVSAAAKQHVQDVLTEHISQSDVVITTALVPGKQAPVLITEKMVTVMQPGSLIVDLAAEQGGNCELSEADQEIEKQGVTIMGPTNLAATTPVHASQLYARNMTSLLELMIQEGKLHLDFDDEIISAACVAHEGKVRI